VAEKQNFHPAGLTFIALIHVKFGMGDSDRHVGPLQNFISIGAQGWVRGHQKVETFHFLVKPNTDFNKL